MFMMMVWIRFFAGGGGSGDGGGDGGDVGGVGSGSGGFCGKDVRRRRFHPLADGNFAMIFLDSRETNTW